ncbi:MAG: UDP-4-amino-4,6-dideoxy-N-acetyl-beta-L-altrosamine transaminase [Prevotellaceae bacterium]|jgi:UDP-4-amino-4,6-dideoxy-N-acetyl-beta-L-altrosamine transaminase|nr:UDP-4-amino-4,6-dideoxy-N-acetyl-beta-L-altrosamine transaminase [Prevotellaceae bacterium]
MMKPIPYGRQSITQADIDAVVDALKSDFLTQGPRVSKFEDTFADYVSAKFAVAVSSGTAALHLSALALGVNEESNIITTPITFAASANCIRYCGGNITFADIDSSTALIDIDAIEILLQSSPQGTYQGIISVDYAGYPVDLERLRAIANEYDLWIISDACHSLGGYFVDSSGRTQKCGNGAFADLTVFSFHPVKHITTGEGGMITTNDEQLYRKLLMLRTHGITKENSLVGENHGGWYYEMQMLGFNYRLPDVNAALGISQLKRADAGLERRIQIAAKYDKAFAGSKIKTIHPKSNIGHAYHLYVIMIENRKQVYEKLREKGIYVQVHYIPVHLLPYYQSLGYKQGTLPAAKFFYEKCLSLPMFPGLTDEEQEFIIENIIQLNFLING